MYNIDLLYYILHICINIILNITYLWPCEVPGVIMSFLISQMDSFSQMTWKSSHTSPGSLISRLCLVEMLDYVILTCSLTRAILSRRFTLDETMPTHCVESSLENYIFRFLYNKSKTITLISRHISSICFCSESTSPLPASSLWSKASANSMSSFRNLSRVFSSSNVSYVEALEKNMPYLFFPLRLPARQLKLVRVHDTGNDHMKTERIGRKTLEILCQNIIIFTLQFIPFKISGLCLIHKGVCNMTKKIIPCYFKTFLWYLICIKVYRSILFIIPNKKWMYVLITMLLMVLMVY